MNILYVLIALTILNTGAGIVSYVCLRKFLTRAEALESHLESFCDQAIDAAGLARGFADHARGYYECAERDVTLVQGYLGVTNRAMVKAETAAGEALQHRIHAEAHRLSSQESARISLQGAQQSVRRPIRSESCSRCASNVVKFSVDANGVVVCANCAPDAYIEAQRG